METGLLFLMPFSKNIIKDNELSIQIFKNGFSLCTSKVRPFFKFENRSIEKEDEPNAENIPVEDQDVVLRVVPSDSSE